MSRLRARTWTALERRVMKAWKFWNGFVVPIEALVADGEVLHQARGIFVDAERIMRTKGIVALLANGQRAVQSAEDEQWFSRRPYMHLMRVTHNARWIRHTRYGFIPSDFNPNIYVRAL